MLRRLLTPGWLALHLAAVVVFAGLVGLGRWQWDRAHDTGRFQNWSYAFEWWLFAAFAVFLWVKTMADSLEDAAAPVEVEPAPVAAPPVVTQADEDEDPELAAYNRRLAALHAHDQAERAAR